MTSCTHGDMHSDAAKRLSDAAMLHWAAVEYDSVGKFIAFKLDDGFTDNTLYPDRMAAVKHQKDEYNCGYIHLHPGGMSVCEAEIILKVSRQIAKAFPANRDDSQSGKSFITPITGESLLTQMRALTRRRI